MTATFDGGRITSDGGVLLLAQAEEWMDICNRIAACIVDPRDPSRVVHLLSDILRARVLTISCGYEDADDLDALHVSQAEVTEQRAMLDRTQERSASGPSGLLPTPAMARPRPLSLRQQLRMV